MGRQQLQQQQQHLSIVGNQSAIAVAVHKHKCEKYRIYSKCYKPKLSVRMYTLPGLPHMLHLLHGIMLPTIFASANRLATSAISWCTEFDLPACCLFCFLRLMMLTLLLLLVGLELWLLAVVIAVAAACCCCASGKMSATWQHAWLANECQTYWTVANVSDWQAIRVHTQQHTLDYTHLAHFAAVALVLVMLPATCCCQRPDWPGKRQIRRTIALDFYLSNVYGPLAGQAVAQSSALADSQRLQKNTTHTTLQSYTLRAHSPTLWLSNFFHNFAQQPHFLWYPINFNAYACLWSDIGTAIQAILRYYYAPFAQGSAIFWLTPVTLITWADETIIIISSNSKSTAHHVCIT